MVNESRVEVNVALVSGNASEPLADRFGERPDDQILRIAIQ